MTAAITGVGHVGASGLGLDAVARALAGAPPPAIEVDRSAGWHVAGSARTALLCPGADLTPWVPAAAARRMSRPSRLAVAAAKMAIENAGATGFEPDGVVFATAFGPAAFTEKLLREILADPETASPFLFTECVANAPTAEVALAIRARGTNWTVTQREAGPVLALARAAAEIEEGRARTVVAGAVEEITPLLHGVLDRFRALARPGRPGFVAAEASTALVVEEETAAAARGTRPLARIVARGRAFDPTATPGTWGREGGAIGRAMRRSFDPATIDAVVSGASGARDGDREEMLALDALFEGLPPRPIHAPKAVVGEFGGGYLLAALPTLAAGARRVLVTGLASGGAAGWLVLERP